MTICSRCLEDYVLFLLTKKKKKIRNPVSPSLFRFQISIRTSPIQPFPHISYVYVTLTTEGNNFGQMSVVNFECIPLSEELRLQSTDFSFTFTGSRTQRDPYWTTSCYSGFSSKRSYRKNQSVTFWMSPLSYEDKKMTRVLSLSFIRPRKTGKFCSRVREMRKTFGTLQRRTVCSGST